MENRKLREQIIGYKIAKRNLFFYTKYKNYANLDDYLNKIAVFLELGGEGIELDGEGTTDREFLQAAKLTKQLCAQYDSTFMIKSRADIALLSSADCINLNRDNLDILSVREILGGDILIGFYINSLKALDLVKDGVDYINYQILPTPTEPAKLTGLEYAKRVSEKISFPVVLIGDENIDYTTTQLNSTDRIAIDDAIYNYSSPNKVTVNLLSKLKK